VQWAAHQQATPAQHSAHTAQQQVCFGECDTFSCCVQKRFHCSSGLRINRRHQRSTQRVLRSSRCVLVKPLHCYVDICPEIVIAVVGCASTGDISAALSAYCAAAGALLCVSCFVTAGQHSVFIARQQRLSCSCWPLVLQQLSGVPAVCVQWQAMQHSARTAQQQVGC
jgi:hypothetical protein